MRGYFYEPKMLKISKETPRVEIPSFTGQQNYERLENNMYKSPIEAMKEYSEAITRQEENEIITQIQETLGIVVDKDELVKALNYDRNQYNIGFLDGKKEASAWIPVSSGKLPQSFEACEVTVVRKDKRWNQKPYIRLAEWNDELQDWFIIPYPITQLHGERLSESDGGDATVTAWRLLTEPYMGGE